MSGKNQLASTIFLEEFNQRIKIDTINRAIQLIYKYNGTRSSSFQQIKNRN